MSDAPDLKKSGWTVKRISILVIFIALSAVGSLVKIPSPVGAAALDSCPGFFIALAFGYLEGAVVIAIGHLLTAATVGFPMTLPIHIGAAASMAICAFVFRFVGIKLLKGKIGLIAAVIITTLLNGFGGGLLAVLLGGWGLYFALLPSLLVASAMNTIIAAIAYYSVRNSKLLN